MTTATSTASKQAKAAQEIWVGNGNEAAAYAIVQIDYDGEGYYPITPSSDVGESVSQYINDGQKDMAFVVGTSELAALSIVTGMAVAGGRAVDVTSANGLLLKAEQMPAISGLGLPIVLNLSTRDVSAPLNIKNGHSDLAACLGFGWLILLAPTVQAVYDMNIIAVRLAEAVDLPAIVAYDGFHTSHANRRIDVFADAADVNGFVGPKPKQVTLLDVDNPHTFGPYMNDDLINSKVQLEAKMDKAAQLLPGLLKEFAALSGRRYDLVEVHGDADADVALVALNTAGEAAKDAVDILRKQGKKVKVIVPRVLRPWPAQAVRDAIGDTKRIVVCERVSQYGAGNYLANEIGALLQPEGNDATIIQRTYGIGGLNFTCDDALYMFDLGARWPDVEDEDEKRVKWYYGAWPGDESYDPAQTIQPITAEQTTLNKDMKGVNLRVLSQMPTRFDKHSACPGCGIFTNLNLFLRGIDGHVVLFFNTGCGMVVTTGYPLTSFKVPYFHNLFHNASSSASGAIEMYKRFKRQGKIKEEITFVVVTGDGGDDIGMDQVIGAALRNDPMIVLEYDNKGYMNTGAQLCYTGYKGELSSNAPRGSKQTGKQTHHKDIIEILRGTFAPYLFQGAESNPQDLIKKARRAQQTVRDGGFAFGKVLSVCPLNWGMEEHTATDVIESAVDACLHPLFEIDHGVTTVNYDPEKREKKIPVTEAFKKMGRAFSHVAGDKFAALAADVQAEVDRRWARLKAMSENPLL